MYCIHTYYVGIGYTCYRIQKYQTESKSDNIIQEIKDSIEDNELFDSAQEATEAALLYILQNLIK